MPPCPPLYLRRLALATPFSAELFPLLRIAREKTAYFKSKGTLA